MNEQGIEVSACGIIIKCGECKTLRENWARAMYYWYETWLGIRACLFIEEAVNFDDWFLRTYKARSIT